MMDSQYGLPVLIWNGNDPVELQRVSLGRSGETNGYNESWLQELVFNKPACLPVAEIDQAFSELIPVCRELNTPVGPIDVLYVTPKGRLVILEAKLWRNPEARRKVVGQILDYAKEVSRWTYDDLQREVARVTGRKGNALFELVRESYPDVDEASFVDEVARGLRLGRFLLLIVGDGIREGVGAIAEFLERYGSLDFTFGLVEMGIYQIDGQDLLVQPRVLSKTMVFRRSVVVLEQRGLEVQEEGEEQEQSEEQHERSQFFHEFWSHFLGHLQFGRYAATHGECDEECQRLLSDATVG